MYIIFIFFFYLFQLAHALCVLGVNARGPLLEKYSDQLEQDCKRVWIPDRQVCEVLSLTGNSCTKPTHTLSSSEDRFVIIEILIYSFHTIIIKYIFI